MTISRRDAFRVAADVLERSDWLTVELLADLGDENASENADRIVEILREMAQDIEGNCEVCGERPSVVTCVFLNVSVRYCASAECRADLIRSLV